MSSDLAEMSFAYYRPRHGCQRTNYTINKPTCLLHPLDWVGWALSASNPGMVLYWQPDKPRLYNHFRTCCSPDKPPYVDKFSDCLVCGHEKINRKKTPQICCAREALYISNWVWYVNVNNCLLLSLLWGKHICHFESRKNIYMLIKNECFWLYWICTDAL